MNPDGKVAVHVLSHENRTCTKAFPVISYCGEIVTTYAGCGDIDFFPVFFGLTGYTGAHYGLVWPGSGSCFFTSCSDLVIGQIAWSGDGIAHAWTHCHMESAVIPGWGWIASNEPGLICVDVHPGTNTVEIIDCNFDEDYPTMSFCAGVCGEAGMDPCEEPPPYVALDVAIESSVGSGCIFVGDDMTYTISYGNTANPGTVNGTVLTCAYSPGTALLYVSSGGTQIYGGRVRWNIGILPVGATGSVQMTVRVKQETLPGTILPVTAVIGCNESPESTASDSTMVCVEEFAPLGLSKDDNVGVDEMVPVGDYIVYTITFDNADNAAAVNNVVVVDYLSSLSHFVSASDGGAYDSGPRTVTWDAGVLPGGARDSVELTTRVGYAADDFQTIVNSCSVKGDETRTTRIEERTKVQLAKVAIHVRPHAYWHKCTGDTPHVDNCRDIQQCTDSCDVTVYPVFFDFPEFQAFEYSMVWPADWGSMAFISCSDATIGSIVHPWDRVVQTWNECHGGGLKIPAVCHVTATGPGQIRVAENWDTGRIGITTCRGNTYNVTLIFPGGVCGEYVSPPCGGPTRTVPTTWGKIKSMFR